jgi:hypothetical protein
MHERTDAVALAISSLRFICTNRNMDTRIGSSHFPAFLKAATWLWDYGISVISVLSPVCMSIAFFLLTDEGKRLFASDEPDKAAVDAAVDWWSCLALIVCGIAAIASSLCEALSKPKVSKLLVELADAKRGSQELADNARALCGGVVQDLAKGLLGFGKKGPNTDRITLYMLDSLENLQQVGRFSFNPSYITQGRPSYPKSQGLIGQGWANGWHFAILPDAMRAEDDWVAECVRQGIPKRTATKIRMKSSLYCVCTVRREGGELPAGVIVVESTASDRYTQDELRALLTEDRLCMIGRMLTNLRPWLADEGDASKKGL